MRDEQHDFAPLFQRYAIRVDENVASEMLSFWSWLLPGCMSPIITTNFGDWFLADAQSNLFFLDLLDGTVNPLEATIGDLKMANFAERFKDQLSIDWTEVCLSKGMHLEPDCCYGWKVPPIMGGSLSSSNIQTFGLRVYQSLSAQLHQQLRSFPEGKKVTGYTADR